MASKYLDAVVASGWTPDQELYLATDVIYDLLVEQAHRDDTYDEGQLPGLYDQATQIAQRVDVHLNAGVAR